MFKPFIVFYFENQTEIKISRYEIFYFNLSKIFSDKNLRSTNETLQKHFQNPLDVLNGDSELFQVRKEGYWNKSVKIKFKQFLNFLKE